MKKLASLIIKDLFDRYPKLIPCEPAVTSAVIAMIECYRSGGKLLVCGNGGSAADALHIVGELMKAFVLPRKISDEMREKIAKASTHSNYINRNLQGALPAIALVGEISLETAYANDIAPDLSFAQQVYGYGNAGDVLLAISTSGNSKNVIYATEIARAKEVKVIGLTGGTGGELKLISDVAIVVPADETYKIQEYHLPIYHTICLALEIEFFGE